MSSFNPDWALRLLNLEQAWNHTETWIYHCFVLWFSVVTFYLVYPSCILNKLEINRITRLIKADLGNLLPIRRVLPGTSWHSRAFTEVFRCSLSAAIIVISSRDLHPISIRSLSTVRRQAVLGLPLLFFPSWALLIAMLQSLLRSCFRMWPIILQLRYFISSLWFHARSLQQLLSTDMILPWIRRIFCKHLLWNTSIALSSPLFIFHVSHPYNSTDTTSPDLVKAPMNSLVAVEMYTHVRSSFYILMLPCQFLQHL